MNKKGLIDFLVANNGLPKGSTWWQVGKQFGFKHPKPEGKTEYEQHEYIRQKVSRIWHRYLKQKNNLNLVKETYNNGVLVSEVFRKIPKDEKVDMAGMELEALTTNPHGGQWLKYKKKERFYDEKHLKELKEILTKNITPLQIIPVKYNNNKALFIHGADKHIGALTKINSIYKNKYNKKEIRKRLVEFVLNEIREQVETFGTFDALFIMDYGDALDGFNGKTTGGLRGTSSHTLPQQLNNREQHDFYVEVHRELFDEIHQEAFAANIYFIATSDSNHGGDFEYGAMRNLQTYLEVKYPYIKTFVSDQPINHFIYGDHCIIFGHGKDDEDMKHGMPLVLNDKVENYIADYIRTNKLENYHISFISADLHQSAETYGKNFRYRKVLSQYGSTKWMHTNFGSGSPGLSSEVFFKHRRRIIKTDQFFDIGDQSNTGLKL